MILVQAQFWEHWSTLGLNQKASNAIEKVISGWLGEQSWTKFLSQAKKLRVKGEKQINRQEPSRFICRELWEHRGSVFNSEGVQKASWWKWPLSWFLKTAYTGCKEEERPEGYNLLQRDLLSFSPWEADAAKRDSCLLPAGVFGVFHRHQGEGKSKDLSRENWWTTSMPSTLWSWNSENLFLPSWIPASPVHYHLKCDKTKAHPVVCW